MLLDDKEYTVPEAQISTKELLLKSAAYMREHGLSKGRFQNEKGAVCIQGAMHIVLGADAFGMKGETYLWASQPVRDACTAIQSHLGLDPASAPYEWHGAVDWNNDPTVTEAEVIAGLESTAHSL